MVRARSSAMIKAAGALAAATLAACLRAGFNDHELCVDFNCSSPGDARSDTDTGGDGIGDASGEASGPETDTAGDPCAGGDCGGDEATTLTAVFATPNTIVWLWDAAPLGSDVAGYFMWYATDAASLASHQGTAASFDATGDPNLAYSFSPYGPKVVSRTTLVGLSPQTTYDAQLWVNNTDGGSRLVATASGSTTAIPAQRFVIFDETMPPGQRQDLEETLATEAHSGNASLWVTGADAWVNSWLIDMCLDISGVAASSWDHAYFETYIQLAPPLGTPNVPVYYAELFLDPLVGTTFAYRYPFYASLPATPGWHQLQVPLSAFLQDDVRPMTPANFGAVLKGVTISLLLPQGVTMYIDDMAIWY